MYPRSGVKGGVNFKGGGGLQNIIIASLVQSRCGASVEMIKILDTWDFIARPHEKHGALFKQLAP